MSQSARIKMLDRSLQKEKDVLFYRSSSLFLLIPLPFFAKTEDLKPDTNTESQFKPVNGEDLVTALVSAAADTRSSDMQSQCCSSRDNIPPQTRITNAEAYFIENTRSNCTQPASIFVLCCKQLTIKKGDFFVTEFSSWTYF